MLLYDHFNFNPDSTKLILKTLLTVHDTESQKQSIVPARFCWLYFIVFIFSFFFLTFTSNIWEREIDTGWFIFKIKKNSLCSSSSSFSAWLNLHCAFNGLIKQANLRFHHISMVIFQLMLSGVFVKKITASFGLYRFYKCNNLELPLYMWCFRLFMKPFA